MALFDLASRIKPVFGFTSTVGTANVNTVACDTAGFESVTVAFSAGTGNIDENIYAVPYLYESDDNTRANATAVPVVRIDNVPNVNEANTTFWASFVPVKRYVFAEIDPVGGHMGTPITATFILGDAHDQPTTLG